MFRKKLHLILNLRNNIWVHQNYCVCWRVSRALRERVVKDDVIRMSCLSNQVDDMMISTILRFPTNAIVLSQAFRLLGALAYGNDIVSRAIS